MWEDLVNWNIFRIFKYKLKIKVMEFIDIISITSNQFVKRYYVTKGGKKEVVEESCSRSDYFDYLDSLEESKHKGASFKNKTANMTENLFDKEQLLKMKLEIKRERIRMLIEQKKFIQKQLDIVENEMFKLEDELDKHELNKHNKNVL